MHCHLDRLNAAIVNKIKLHGRVSLVLLQLQQQPFESVSACCPPISVFLVTSFRQRRRLRDYGDWFLSLLLFHMHCYNKMAISFVVEPLLLLLLLLLHLDEEETTTTPAMSTSSSSTTLATKHGILIPSPDYTTTTHNSSVCCCWR